MAEYSGHRRIPNRNKCRRNVPDPVSSAAEERGGKHRRIEAKIRFEASERVASHYADNSRAGSGNATYTHTCASLQLCTDAIYAAFIHCRCYVSLSLSRRSPPSTYPVALVVASMRVTLDQDARTRASHGVQTLRPSQRPLLALYSRVAPSD